jgi:predicted transposase YbfD/YdcC
MAPVADPKGSAEDLKGTAEITNLPEFIAKLRAQYGDLCSNFKLDAGLWSKAVFLAMDEQFLGVFAALKSNRGELFDEAARLFRTILQRQDASADSGWETYKGGKIRRRLWRTAKLDGWMGWRNLRQVFAVEQTTKNAQGEVVHVEIRYFATNHTTGALSPRQALHLVRQHWSIENDCNWTFDMQFGEDDGAWCTQGASVLALAVLRMIAYNLLQHLRKSHAKVLPQPRTAAAPTAAKPRPWRSLQTILGDWLRRAGAELRLLWQPPRPALRTGLPATG